MMKLTVIAASVVLIVVAVGSIIHFTTLDGRPGFLFSYLSDNEDAVYAAGCSNSGFRQVRMGMSRKDVIMLIGAPLDVWTNQAQDRGTN